MTDSADPLLAARALLVEWRQQLQQRLDYLRAPSGSIRSPEQEQWRVGKIAEIDAVLAARAPALKDDPPQQIHDVDTRVAPSVPCVETAGSTAEKQQAAVTAAERTEPQKHIIDLAIEVSGWSPCRSKRGAVLFRDNGDVVKHGHNYKPRAFACDGSSACKATCRFEAIHAEQQALMSAGYGVNGAEGAAMLHVKTVDGVLVPSGGPSCVECSKLALVAGVTGIWLYRGEDGWVWYPAETWHRLSLQARALRAESADAHSTLPPVSPRETPPTPQIIRPDWDGNSCPEWDAQNVEAADRPFVPKQDRKAPSATESAPDFWRCKTCSCLWRDNHDDTVSLASVKQTSCVECEMNATPNSCEPLFRQPCETPLQQAQLEAFKAAARKFIDKCDSGRAQSVDTYRELKAALEMGRETPSHPPQEHEK